MGTSGCGCVEPTPTPSITPSGLHPPYPPWPPGPSPSITPTPSISTQSQGSGGDINNDPQGIGNSGPSSPLLAPPNVADKKTKFCFRLYWG